MTGYGPYVRGEYYYIGPYTYDISKGQHEQYFFEEGLNNEGVMKKVDGNWQLNVVYSKQLKSQNNSETVPRSGWMHQPLQSFQSGQWTVDSSISVL